MRRLTLLFLRSVAILSKLDLALPRIKAIRANRGPQRAGPAVGAMGWAWRRGFCEPRARESLRFSNRLTMPTTLTTPPLLSRRSSGTRIRCHPLLKEAFMSAAPVLPTSPASPTEPAPLSEGARVLNTFIAPSKTFTDLKRNRSWWAPWILISIVSVLFMYAISRQVGFEQVSRNQIAHSSRADQFDKLPPDQQARQLRFSSKLIAIIGYSNPALVLVFLLIETVVLWGTFKVAVSAETSFQTAYAIVMYAALPGVIGAILAIISLFAGVSPEAFDINNPAGTNLAYYLDPETTGRFLRGMASAVDVFTWWSIVLIGIGFACTSKVKRSTAIIIVAVSYLLFKLLGAGLAAM
jgi:hypothetical protein